MKHYKIIAQHVKPGVLFEDEYQNLISSTVVPYFNARSLLAKNPKQIINFEFSEDKTTLTIELESQEVLPMPSKALRLFSTYLVSETFVGDGNYLAGKQLFKMASEEYEEDSPETLVKNNDKGIASVNTNCLEMMEKAVARTAELLRKGDLDTVLKYIGEGR
jgi:hypothetical protein